MRNVLHAGPPAVAAVAVLFASCGEITGGTRGPVELVVGIDSPAPGEHFLSGEEVRLIGSATEREVPLDGNVLTWQSSISGNLGTGTVLTRHDLAEGRHTIRLFARGSDATGSDSIEIVVLGEGGTLAFTALPPGVGSSYNRLQLLELGSDSAITLVASDQMVAYLSPTWGPGGTRLACAIVMGEGGGGIAITDVEGGSFDLLPGTENGSSPAWSPDGSRLAYVGRVERQDQPGEISRLDLISADGGGSAVPLIGEINEYTLNPSWSPAGDSIAFHLDGRIHIIPAEGGPPRPVTPDSLVASDPDWSPDGARLVFVGFPTDDPEGELFSIATDGSDLIRLTTNPGADWGPAWSPSGDRIIFSRNIELSILNTRTGHVLVLDIGGGNADWSPPPGYSMHR